MNKKNLLRMNELKGAEDMPRVSVVFDRRRRATMTEAGTVEVMVYTPRERARKYISTGVRVCVGQWSDEYGVVGRADAENLNLQIRQQVDKCKATVIDAANGKCSLTTDSMRVHRGEASFLDWMNKEIKEADFAPATLMKHEVMFRSLERWGRIRRFEDVTADSLRAYMKFVGDQTVMKGEGSSARPVKVEQTTVHGYWRRLRKWLNVAIRLRLLPMDCYVGVEVKRGKHKEREFLSDDEIQLLLAAKMPNLHLAKAKDLFVLQMGCGLAYQDLMAFDFSRRTKMGDFWTVQGLRKKTKEQFFVILLPWAVEVLERWGWQVPALSNQKYNDYIGSVMEIAGIDKHVTSHIARHSFACYALRHGVRIEALSRALGHTDIRTTQIYARLVDNDVVEAFGKMK